MGTVISLTVPAGRTLRPELPAGDASWTPRRRRRTRVCRPGRDLQPVPSRFRGEPAGARRAVTLRDASAGMRDRYADAAGWRLLTEGAFTPERPDGVLDLSGIIKGYAIEQAGTALRRWGSTDWCLNAGGDVLVRGSPVPGSGASWLAGDRGSAGPRGAARRASRWADARPLRRAGDVGLGGARGPHLDGPERAAGRRRIRPGLRGRRGHCHGRRAGDGDRRRRTADAGPGHRQVGHRGACRPLGTAGNCSRRRGSGPSRAGLEVGEPGVLRLPGRRRRTCP